MFSTVGIMTPKEIAETQIDLWTKSPEYRQLQAEAAGAPPADQVTTAAREPASVASPAPPKPADPIADWERAVDAEVAKSSGTRSQAIASVVKANPALHRDYLAAFNARRQSR